MDFIIGMLRTMFFALDKIIYGLIDDVYALLMQIARTSIFDQDAIHAFSRRIYVMLGIFMLFKLMISIANYILNPDDLVDKDKGFTNIVKKAILSLVMIVLVPYIFNEAYALQSIILRENTIMNIVFGSPSERAERAGAGGGSANATYVNTAGQKIQFTIMYTFFQPNFEEYSTTTSSNLLSCKEAYKKDPDNDNNYMFRKRITFDGDDDSKKDQTSGYIYELNPQCFGEYDSSNDNYVESDTNGQLIQVFKAAGDDKNASLFQNYAQGVAQQNFELMFKKDIAALKNDNGTYVIDYKYGVSTAIGVAVVYLFLLFCIDIAARSIKLGFLELIAPIPIISYCDPKSGKDGMFKKWFDMCWKTYLELFFRLFALYFGIYVISLVGTFKDVVTNEYVDNWLVSIFMILGILIFIKKLPEILKDGLGINTSGKFQLNPLKKIEDEALGGKLISGVARKGIGVATGAATGLAAGALTGRGVLSGVKAGIASGWKGDKFGKKWSNSYSAGKERSKQLAEMDADGVKPIDVMKDKLYNRVHSQSRGVVNKAWSSKIEAVTKSWDTVRGSVAAVDGEAKRLKMIEDGIKQGGTSAFKDKYVTNAAGARVFKSAADQYAEALEAATKNLDKRVQDIVDDHSKMDDGAGGKAGGDAAIANITNTIKTMDTLIGQINDAHIKYVDATGTVREVHLNDSSVKGVKASSKGAIGEKNAWESSSTYTTQQDIEKYSGGKKS